MLVLRIDYQGICGLSRFETQKFPSHQQMIEIDDWNLSGFRGYQIKARKPLGM